MNVERRTSSGRGFIRGRWLGLHLAAGMVFFGMVATAGAETIILKDGTFVEGRILVQTSRSIRVETRLGIRSILRKDIEQIVDSLDSPDPDAAKRFAELPEALKAVLNAEAEYKLGRYQEALKRLEPFRDHADNKAVRIRIDWLVIEINQRLGQWDKARRMLEEKKEKGLPSERIRAEAHLDIMKANPAYDLRFVGDRHARNFILNDAVLSRARESGSLADAEVMRLALEEYCTQLLARDELSVRAFENRLNLRETLETMRKLPPAGYLGDHMPYKQELQRAENAVYRAQCILGDFGVAFELDLVRAELIHLIPVITQLFDEAMQLNPANFVPPFDANTRRLTADGRRQWEQRCDEYLRAIGPVTRLVEYMVDKVDRFPEGLRDLRMILIDFQSRLEDSVRAVKRSRNRTHV